MLNPGRTTMATTVGVTGVDTASSRSLKLSGYFWGLLRILIGWNFLWAFFDKLFGLGFATCRAPTGGTIDTFCSAAFVKGGSPTYGFLTFGTKASHTGSLFDWLASSGPTHQSVTDWLFMAVLLGVGVALTLGVFVRITGIGAALVLTFMYLAGFVWPQNNPFLDDHILQIVALVGIVVADAGQYLGLGRWWAHKQFVQRHPILK
jgi:thiosulfate dehydrogenase [quinone] large subunit